MVIRINRAWRYAVTHWELLAALALILITFGAFGTAAVMDATAPRQATIVQFVEVSVEEAIRECGGAPVTRSERHESSGTVQIWVCPSGREILAYRR